MNDRKTQRIELLRRLREMDMEQARALHATAQEEHDRKRAQAEDTQGRIVALDEWSAAQVAGGAPLLPEVMRQAQLFRGVETQVLERQRGEERQSLQRAETAQGELRQRFEELSVAERLGVRHAQTVTLNELRRGYVALDEAGAQKKNQEAKE
jgi:hypothetical protein